MTENKKGLLYPAMHKFYSALSSLEKFEKGSNFFDNITSLDNFLSEYRNITFVLQKSLAHTEYFTIYEKLRDKYLVNDVCKWFIEKRNSVLKQQPFDLEKRIRITIYSDDKSLSLPVFIYTIENDVKYSSIIDSLKKRFLEVGIKDVCFSAEFSFYEAGSTEDLYDNFITGINHMKQFMSELKNEINEDCKICEELQSKIDDFYFHRIPKNMLLIDDYIYYTEQNQFKKGSRVEVMGDLVEARVPIVSFEKMFGNTNLVESFIIMHLQIFSMQNVLMPTSMLVFNDKTFNMLSFDSSIKTTIFRKLNEIATRIENEDIDCFFYVTQMLRNGENFEVLNFDEFSSGSINHEDEVLAFFIVNKDAEVRSYFFDAMKCDDANYVASILLQEPNMSLLENFINPIIDAFKKKYK